LPWSSALPGNDCSKNPHFRRQENQEQPAARMSMPDYVGVRSEY
jgi:hypothetical protein